MQKLFTSFLCILFFVFNLQATKDHRKFPVKNQDKICLDDIKFRWAGEKTVEKARDTFISSYKGLYKGQSQKRYSSWWNSFKKDYIKHFKKNKRDIFFLTANLKDKIVGFVVFILPKSSKNAYLDLLIVEPEFQGFGLGRKLLFSIKERFRRVKKIFLLVDRNNKKAKRIYKHLGFVEYNNPKEDDPDKWAWMEYVF